MHDLKNRLRFASYYVRFRTDVLIGRHRNVTPDWDPLALEAVEARVPARLSLFQWVCVGR